MSFKRRILKAAKRWLALSKSSGQRAGALTRQEQQLAAAIRARNLTYLSEAKLAALAESCRTIERDQVPGMVVEAGCALGGSTIFIASIKGQGRPMKVYDVFGMIPSPTQEDTAEVHARYDVIRSGESKGIGGEEYYGYRRNLFDDVTSNLADFGIHTGADGVELICGLIEDTMDIDQSVALAHIDVDWYEPVKTCLQRIVPRLPVGGMVILDDYHDWGGCRKATDEYFAGYPGDFSLDDAAGSMKVTRIRHAASG